MEKKGKGKNMRKALFSLSLAVAGLLWSTSASAVPTSLVTVGVGNSWTATWVDDTYSRNSTGSMNSMDGGSR